MTNNNGWTKWLVATLWGVLVMVIMFMGNVVNGNNVKNNDEHKDIRKENMETKEIVIRIDTRQETLIKAVERIETSIENKL